MNLFATVQFNGTSYQADLNKPLDISISLKGQPEQVNCFYAPLFETEPVVAGDFIGSTARGGAVNFLNIKINPHGNGTHTECVGHIARRDDFETDREIVFTINECLNKFHFFGKLATLYPVRQSNGDRVILPDQIEGILEPGETEALIIRTMPNTVDKRHRSYSGTNPPYIDHRAVEYMVKCGVRHLLIDLPSVDREEDEGKLLSHKAFWQYNDLPPTAALRRVEDFGRKNCTITELIYVTDEIKDGLYLLNIQIASMEIDASPSKPVLYEILRE